MTGLPLAQSLGARPWARFLSAFGLAGVALTVALNLFIDIVYGLLDPRIGIAA